MHFVQYQDEVTFQYVTILLSKSRKLWTVSVYAHKIEIVARILLRPKGAGSFHIHRKTIKDLWALAVLGVRELPNLAQNLVTHSQ